MKKSRISVPMVAPHSLTLQMFWGHSPKRRYVTLLPERAKWKSPFTVTPCARYNGRTRRAEK